MYSFSSPACHTPAGDPSILSRAYVAADTRRFTWNGPTYSDASRHFTAKMQDEHLSSLLRSTTAQSTTPRSPSPARQFPQDHGSSAISYQASEFDLAGIHFPITGKIGAGQDIPAEKLLNDGENGMTRHLPAKTQQRDDLKPKENGWKIIEKGHIIPKLSSIL